MHEAAVNKLEGVLCKANKLDSKLLQIRTYPFEKTNFRGRHCNKTVFDLCEKSMLKKMERYKNEDGSGLKALFDKRVQGKTKD